ncbi:MAG: PAS domain-containing protein [Pyrinomonadaceae bacterium]
MTAQQLERIQIALSAATLTVLTDETGRILDANDRFLAATGYTLEQIERKRLRLLDPEYHPATVLDEASQAIGQNQTWRGELCFRIRSGGELWLSVCLTPFVDQDEPRECVAVCFDITGRHAVEEQLRVSEASLTAAERIAHLGSCQVTLINEGEFETAHHHWSDEVFRMFGYQPHSFEPSNAQFFQAVHPDDRDRVERAVRLVLEAGAEFQLEYRIVRPNGEVRVVESNAEARWDTDRSRPTKMVGTFRDITERKRTELALREGEEQLRQSQKIEAVGKLAGGIAHDFNNLLAVILLHTDLLLVRTPPDDPQRHRIEEIRASTERAASLTRQLLAFSRKQVLQPRHLDLNSVVTDTDRMLRRMIGEDIEVKLILDPEPAQIWADPDQLGTVILNLAVNARDAMSRGGRFTIETGRAEIALDQATADAPAGRYAVLIVSDTGHGMSHETKERVFEPFFSTRATGQGSGLGLSTVYGIVRQSGGHIKLESELDQGTTFCIYLPVLERPAYKFEESIEPLPELGSETVMVVEDEDLVRKVACDVLKLHGYTVLPAANGPEAIQLASEFEGPIHLLLTDIVMPKMGGPELATELVKMRPDLRVLLMSGYAGDTIIDHGGVGNAAFIAKPFTRAGLARRVREVLDAK